MPISKHDLVDRFGAAVQGRNSAVFVGAGLSQGAGYPGWEELLVEARDRAKLPIEIQDLPLVAQYYVNEVPGGRESLEALILQDLAAVARQPSAGLDELSRLPVTEIWTTNYDTLIEDALPGRTVVRRDDDLRNQQSVRSPRIIKMHGSVTDKNAQAWATPPVITRSDYETYETEHPRLWALLRASYLTRPMLFLGFSFTDPNIEVLLRLSRSIGPNSAPRHFTVMRRPSDTDPESERRLHALQVRDLEASGVHVCEIENFNELDDILRSLNRRSRGPEVLVSGSIKDNNVANRASKVLGHRLAATPLRITSLAGESAMRASFALGKALVASGRYTPDAIHFFFRRRTGSAPALEERLGTAVYTSFDLDDLRTYVFGRIRAVLVVGGSRRTLEEIDYARSQHLPVVPAAFTGGAAADYWARADLVTAGFPVKPTEDDERNWNLLQHSDDEIAMTATVYLLRRATYTGPSELSDGTSSLTP